MNRLIAIGLSPNIDFSDVRLAAKQLCAPWNFFNTEPIDSMRSVFSSYVGVDEDQVFPSISGRSAINDALELSGLKEGDEVIMQAFNCVAVVNSIVWVGAKPIFVDIEKESLNTSLELIKKKITDKTKAIILQHTFGLPVHQTQEIVEFAHQQGIIVIEDCTHALGATIEGNQVGTFGDFGVYSFGRDKMISSVFGGMLVVKDFTVVEQARTLFNSKERVSAAWVIKQLLHPILTYPTLLSSPWYLFGKLMHFIAKKIGVISKATSPSEKACGVQPDWVDKKMTGALAVLAEKQLVEFSQSNKRRNEIAQMYLDAGIESVQPATGGRVWLRYPVVVDDPSRYHIEFKRRGIVIGDWYDQVIAPKEVDLSVTGYQVGECPVAEEISSHIMNLPVYPRMTDGEVKRVVDMFKRLQVAG